MKSNPLSLSNTLSYALVGVAFTLLAGCNTKSEQTPELHYTSQVPVGGNSWVDAEIALSETLVSDKGVSGWRSEHGALATYFYVSEVGALDLGMLARVTDRPVTIDVTLGKQNRRIEVSNTQMVQVPVGKFEVQTPGYQKVIISSPSNDSHAMPIISDLLIGGEATAGETYYVKDDFYWGRRGPSVHLQYQMPDETQNYEWFYNEVTVPEGQDTLGSYYMANGFDGGYFGIQVNSDTERRVLFSIWSPYTTDNPQAIPPEYRVELLKKGENVHVGEFGNEGSGGQSFMRYNWEAGVTYGFLTKITPVEGTDKTDFTAYFFDPSEQQWQLIASFRRPKTTTYLAGAYSFLENFMTGAGQFERLAQYDNQWVKTANGPWQEVTSARFTYDATARKQARVDYQGGVNDAGFYLKNTGFFSEHTPYNTVLTRLPHEVAPAVNLELLPE
ncbi:DUF3472 domain-containing protein [Pseudoalteromonas pernae]|uniref:DUF3472 domain-containing protein n=1 Tax=Pseudoalteromonas pernae TaxID=3118054 RepID=UPI0032422A09